MKKTQPHPQAARGKTTHSGFLRSGADGILPSDRRPLRLRDQRTQGLTVNWNPDFLAPNPRLCSLLTVSPSSWDQVSGEEITKALGPQGGGCMSGERKESFPSSSFYCLPH